MSVQIGTTRPARRMFMPAQFVAQGGVMTMAGRMQKGHGITRAAYFHHIFQLKLSQRLGIEIHVHFAPVDDLDRNPRMIWQDDRAVEPVGVAAISPSERCRYIKQSSTYTLSSTMPEMPLRFTTTSLKASA